MSLNAARRPIRKGLGLNLIGEKCLVHSMNFVVCIVSVVDSVIYSSWSLDSMTFSVWKVCGVFRCTKLQDSP